MSQMKIVEQIREHLVTSILQGPKPPSDEMALLGLEYQEVWRTHAEAPIDATPVTVLDRICRWLPKSQTPAELLFKQEMERLHRKRRRIESEQLISLHGIERLLEDNENWRQRLLEQNRELAQRITQRRTESESQQFSRLQRSNRQKLAELDRGERKLLVAVRRNALEYHDLMKRLEARQEFGPARESAEELDPFAVFGAVLTLSRINDMARNIKKLTEQK